MKMTPILFSDAATDYSTQGLGALADTLSCEVTEELNGEYELQMTYPVSGRRYADIKNRCIIYCKPDPYRGGQPFRIYRITRPLNGVITVYARHISYDLSGIPVNPFTAGSAAAAMAGLKSNSAVSNPFTFWTNLGTTADFSVTVPSSIRSVLGGSAGSILDTYGGEYEWDGMTVRLYSQRGQDNGVRIAYGKNLTDIEQDENIANIATGVIGYWAGTDGTLVQTSVVNAPGMYNFTRVITVDFSSDFEAQPTTEQLQQRTQQYVQDNNIGVPDVSITVSWIQLEQYSGYEGLSLLERVTLGDTVTVEFPPLGVEATARVVKTTYDALLDRYTTADIGSVRANIADTIANQQQQIANTPGKSEIQQIAEAITDTILGANGGAVRILDTNGDGEPDTLYIADNPDPAQAVKVWRFNYEGWGASQNGYDGPFEMGAALGVGLYADFITAGTLNAALVDVINLIADHVVSTSGDYTLDIWAAVQQILDGNNLRLRTYVTGTNQSIGILQVFSGNVKANGTMGRGSRVTQVQPSFIECGADSGGNCSGTIKSGTIEAQTAKAQVILVANADGTGSQITLGSNGYVNLPMVNYLGNTVRWGSINGVPVLTHT